MIVGSVDLFANYAQVNEQIDRCQWFGGTKPAYLSNDRNVEDPVLILGVRKWIDSGLSAEGPYLGNLRLRMAEHVALSDKYDLFIYEWV